MLNDIRCLEFQSELSKNQSTPVVTRERAVSGVNQENLGMRGHQAVRFPSLVCNPSKLDT